MAIAAAIEAKPPDAAMLAPSMKTCGA